MCIVTFISATKWRSHLTGSKGRREGFPKNVGEVLKKIRRGEKGVQIGLTNPVKRDE